MSYDNISLLPNYVVELIPPHYHFRKQILFIYNESDILVVGNCWKMIAAYRYLYTKREKIETTTQSNSTSMTRTETAQLINETLDKRKPELVQLINESLDKRKPELVQMINETLDKKQPELVQLINDVFDQRKNEVQQMIDTSISKNNAYLLSEMDKKISDNNINLIIAVRKVVKETVAEEIEKALTPIREDIKNIYNILERNNLK